MTQHDATIQARPSAVVEGAGRSMVSSLVKLTRPHQWAKGVFIVIGPAYAVADGHAIDWVAVVLALLAFSLVSSGCYVVNDIRDREADAHHPRKCKRAIASGAVSVSQGWVLAAVLYAGALMAIGALWATTGAPAAGLVGLAVAAYAGNVTAYSFALKRIAILDVMSLSVGFVLRVLGGCAAAGVEPSTWLLNCTLFLAMFLAFGKRLGERRTLGEDAGLVRQVQGTYTDEMLRMLVAMTAVATLVTYAGYVEAKHTGFTFESIGLWATLLPATFGLLRCIVLVERGEYDDPTEIAFRDRAFQAAAMGFGVLTLALLASGAGWFGSGA